MTQLAIGLVLRTQMVVSLVLGSALGVMAMALGDLGWPNERD